MPFGADRTACRSCREIYPARELDRYLWCPNCAGGVRHRAKWWGRWVGLACSVGLALYVALAIHPSERFLAFYALLLALTYVLTARIASALVLGYYRSQGRAPAADGGAARGSDDSRSEV